MADLAIFQHKENNLIYIIQATRQQNSLKIVAYSDIGNFLYEEEAHNYDLYEVFKIIKEQKISISLLNELSILNNARCLELKVGLLKLRLLPNNAVSEVQNVNLKVNLLADFIHRPKIMHLTTTVPVSANVVVWNKQVIPLDTTCFITSQDFKTVTVLQDGYYKIDVQLLNKSGTALYPYVTVNGNGVKFFYGSGSGYQTASLSFPLALKANDVISICCQAGSAEIYNNEEGNTHYFCLHKLS